MICDFFCLSPLTGTRRTDTSVCLGIHVKAHMIFVVCGSQRSLAHRNRSQVPIVVAMEEDYQVHQCMLTIHLRKQNLVIFSNLVSTSTLLYLSSFSWHLSPASHFVSMVIDQSQMPSQQPHTLPAWKVRLRLVHVVWKFPELPFLTQTYLQSVLDPH